MIKGNPVPLPKGRNLFFKRRKNKTSNSAGTTYIEAEISRVWDAEKGFSRPKSVLIGKLCNDREGWMIPNANFFEVFPDAQTSQVDQMDDMPLTRTVGTEVKSTDESSNKMTTSKGKAQDVAKGKAQDGAKGKSQDVAEGKAQDVADDKAQDVAKGKAQDGAKGKAQDVADDKAQDEAQINVLLIASKLKGVPVPLPKGRNLFFKRRKNKTSNSAGTTYIEAEISRVWDSEKGFSRPKSVLIGKLCNDREGWMIPNTNFFEVYPDVTASLIAQMDERSLTSTAATEDKSTDMSSNTMNMAGSKAQSTAPKAGSKAQSTAPKARSKAQGTATKAGSKTHGTEAKA